MYKIWTNQRLKIKQNELFFFLSAPYKWYGVPGEDYPRPMVKHEVVSKENIARHKKAYDAGLSYIFRTVVLYLVFRQIW